MHSGRGVTETSSSWARRQAGGRGDGGVGDDPFALLGLAPRPGLSDDDVRGAWRRIAAATHPDREDGGDPARFGAAAAAYVVLRTGFGRGEALADLGLSEESDHGRHARRRSRPADPSAHGTGRHRARRGAPVGRRTGAPPPGLAWLPRWITRPAANWRPMGVRLTRGPIRRPGALALRMAGVAALALVAVVIAGWSPGVIGVLAGALTWPLVIAGRAFSRRRSQRPF
jgi:hypothetical protein